MSIKTPIGIKPDFIWKEEFNVQIEQVKTQFMLQELPKRIKDLKECIKRYLDADCEIKTEWVTELNEHLKTLERLNR